MHFTESSAGLTLLNCSALETLIFPMMPLTLLDALTIPAMVLPASSTCFTTYSTCRTLPLESALNSRAAFAQRCAKERTALATMAKPRP